MFFHLSICHFKLKGIICHHLCLITPLRSQSFVRALHLKKFILLPNYSNYKWTGTEIESFPNIKEIIQFPCHIAQAFMKNWHASESTTDSSWIQDNIINWFRHDWMTGNKLIESQSPQSLQVIMLYLHGFLREFLRMQELRMQIERNVNFKTW